MNKPEQIRSTSTTVWLRLIVDGALILLMLYVAFPTLFHPAIDGVIINDAPDERLGKIIAIAFIGYLIHNTVHHLLSTYEKKNIQ